CSRRCSLPPNFTTARQEIRGAGLRHARDPRATCFPNLHPILAHPDTQRPPPKPTTRLGGGHMRIVRVLAFGVFAALLVACGAWTLAWFATSPGPADAIQAAAEPKSPKSTIVHEVVPEPPSSSAISAASERKLVGATIHLNSNPQGANATASLGSGCLPRGWMDLAPEGPFTVPFPHKGCVPSTPPGETDPAHPGGSDPNPVPDPIFVTLQGCPAPEAGTKPARSAASH